MLVEVINNLMGKYNDFIQKLKKSSAHDVGSELLDTAGIARLSCPAILSTICIAPVAIAVASPLEWALLSMPMLLHLGLIALSKKSPINRRKFSIAGTATVISLAIFVSMVASSGVKLIVLPWIIATTGMTLLSMTRYQNAVSIMGLMLVSMLAYSTFAGIFGELPMVSSVISLASAGYLGTFIANFMLSSVAFKVSSCKAAVLPDNIVWDGELKSNESYSDIVSFREALSHGMDAVNAAKEKILSAQLVDSSQVCAIKVDNNGHVIEVAGDILDVTGFLGDRLRGDSIAEVIHADDLHMLGALLSEDGGGVVEKCRMRLFTPQCSYKWVEACCTASSDGHKLLILRECWFPYGNAEESSIDSSVSVREVTQAKVRSDFLANISHELRTPLNAIVGFSDIIRNQMFGNVNNNQYVEYADKVYSSGQHMMHLIDELLDLSEIESGAFIKSGAEDISIKDMLDTSFRSYRDFAAERGVDLSIDASVNDDLVKNNRYLVRKLMLHCIKNMILRASHGDIVRVSLFMHSSNNIMVTFSLPVHDKVSISNKVTLGESILRDEDVMLTPKEDINSGMHIAKTLAAYAGAEIITTAGSHEKGAEVAVVMQRVVLTPKGVPQWSHGLDTNENTSSGEFEGIPDSTDEPRYTHKDIQQSYPS